MWDSYILSIQLGLCFLVVYSYSIISYPFFPFDCFILHIEVEIIIKFHIFAMLEWGTHLILSL